MIHRLRILQISATLSVIVSACAACSIAAADSLSDTSSVAVPEGSYAGPLAIPEIARFAHLPMRMILEPEFSVPEVVVLPDERHLPLFDRVLREATEPELVEAAASSLARFAREDLGSIELSFDMLLDRMQTTTDRRVRDACALALVEGDARKFAPALLELARAGDDTVRLQIEPALARWQVPEAFMVWQQRLGNPVATLASTRLACRCLSAAGHEPAVEELSSLLLDVSFGFGKRSAAAIAISQLAPAAGRRQHAIFNTDDPQDRLLAVMLLNSPEPDSTALLAAHCTDANDAVAALAWTQLIRLNPADLETHLNHGRRHRDAVIRSIAAQAMALFPDQQRCAWLNELLSDRHIEVRNAGRSALFSIAAEHAGLKTQIVDQAGETITAAFDDWQGIEQALLLLGQLRADQYAVECVPLLKHPRPEVSVTSAWLMHLFPDPAIAKFVQETIRSQEHRIHLDTTQQAEVSVAGLQLTFLYQFAGLLRDAAPLDLMVKQFSKGEPGGVQKRAAALWAIGLIREGTADTRLGRLLEARVKDRDGAFHEAVPVRRMSLLAMGYLKADTAIPVAEEAFTADGPVTLIPQAAQHVLSCLGEPVPEARPGTPATPGGWRLNPVQ